MCMFAGVYDGRTGLVQLDCEFTRGKVLFLTGKFCPVVQGSKFEKGDILRTDIVVGLAFIWMCRSFSVH